MIATPRAPPICRVVSLTADPTPAFSRGSEPMTDSVAGAIVMPMPTDIRQNSVIASGYGVVASMNDSATRARQMIVSRPVVTMRFVPARSTSRAEIGAVTIIVRAYGTSRMPAPSGL